MDEPSEMGRMSLCPSAQPEWNQSVIIGVVGGTPDAPRIAHLVAPQPVSEEMLALAAPVTPTEVFRFAAPCVCQGCFHFEDDRCRLAARIVNLLPAVTNNLPACTIRAHCRWWQQEGRAACTRCPQIVTDNYNPLPAMREAVGTPAQIGPPIRDAVQH
jgi:hypothetical protein